MSKIQCKCCDDAEMDKVQKPMQEANPTETFPLVMNEASYDRMGEQFLPLILDLNIIT